MLKNSRNPWPWLLLLALVGCSDTSPSQDGDTHGDAASGAAGDSAISDGDSTQGAGDIVEVGDSDLVSGDNDQDGDSDLLGDNDQDGDGDPDGDHGPGGDNNEPGDPASGDSDEAWTLRPSGACTQDADCPLNAFDSKSCKNEIPGGYCNGCGTSAHCPDSEECLVGTCEVYCDASDECAAGMYCGVNNRCLRVSCDVDCPVPFLICDDGYCARAPCGAEDACPELASCIEGYCVPDHELE